MGKKENAVDLYIEKSADFAKPILNHIRELVHQVCPEVKEVIKWQFPNFEYKGNICSMAAFKNHCSMGFWKASLMSDPYKLFAKGPGTSMGQFGQLKSLKDLPSDEILIEYILEAKKLNDEGVKIPKSKSAETKELDIPEYFMEALKQNEKALRTFLDFSFSNKRDYVVWVTEAKTEETRKKRLETSVEWLSEGKVRMWKYVKK